jgi:hypothetical protein
MQNKRLDTDESLMLDSLRGIDGRPGDRMAVWAWTDRSITQGGYDSLVGARIMLPIPYVGEIRIDEISAYDRRPPNVQMGFEELVPGLGDYEHKVEGSILAIGPMVAYAVTLLRALAFAGMSYAGYKVTTDQQSAENVRSVTGSIGSSITWPLVLLGGAALYVTTRK